MSSIDMSSLFGSSTTQNTSLTSMLSDYASIKNGSYGKLLKAYYKQQETDATSEEESAEKSNLSKLKNYSSSLKDAASALNDNSLYAEGEYTVTYSDGTTGTSSYDMDSIYDKVKSFVDAYNTTVSNGASYDEDSSIAKRTLSMISYSSSNSALLSSIGITTSSAEGEEGQLKIDEDTFKKASINSIKSLFSGSGSYGSVIENKASLLSSLAESQISKYSSYSSNGSYSSGSSSLSSLFSSEV
ncbi:MAG: flagellar filament capping protein FliD [Lachnospiraceae bacterium]|nr:flagellar filament capping protein FliD [Lachnospiraceae bacterium]